jgi:AraC-like DNA-binding protein
VVTQVLRRRDARPSPPYDRAAERRRAVALARRFREVEGLSIGQIAGRLGRSPATVKAYFYDPTGEKARAVKARYLGVCRGCGAYTQPRNGKGDAYAYCKACHPGAIERRWTRERVIRAMLEWRARYGQLPSSYDWSRTYARRRGGEAQVRIADGDWPNGSRRHDPVRQLERCSRRAATEISPGRQAGTARARRDAGNRRSRRPNVGAARSWHRVPRVFPTRGKSWQLGPSQRRKYRENTLRTGTFQAS